jgi:hypothetical protein
MANLDNRTLLLETLKSMLQTSRKVAISASETNDVGLSLGLAEAETLQLIRQLDAEGYVQIEWGGAVKLLSRSESKTIHLDKGATYIGDGAFIGAGIAVGSNAMAAGAVRYFQSTSQTQMQAISDLTAAISLLTHLTGRMQSEVTPELKTLIEETRAVLPELRKDAPDKNKIKDRLDEVDKATGILSKVVTMASGASQVSPQVLDLFHKGWQAIASFIGNI